MITRRPQRFSSLIAGTLLGVVLVPTMAPAGAVSLTANDANGAVTSLNGAGKWSNGQAPSAANDYFTSSFFVRTPVDNGNTTYTFAGNSLTLQAVPPGNARSVIVKSGGGDTFIINNLTNALGGILENGGSGNVTATFTGNLWTIAANSGVAANQGSLTIGYPLASATGVIFTNAGGNAGGITYNGDNSLFQGILYISTVNFGNGGGNTKVILNSANGALGNPTTFTPNQIWITAGCTLQDNAGLTFNNPNGGFLLDSAGTTGTANINTAGTTLIAEPITDFTNGVSSVCSLTKLGNGTLVLSNANNNYTGGTIITAGTLQVGMANALPVGNLTDNSILDLNSNNVSVNVLSGAGVIDNSATGNAVLTIGANGASGTFSGLIQNSSGSLTLVKAGAGTCNLTGTLLYSGATVVAGGTLNLNSAGGVPSTPGDLVISNSAVLNGTASSGVSFTANNIIVGANSTYSLLLNGSAIGVNGNGSLTLQDNAVIAANYGSLTANPTAAAINMAGSISAPGTNVMITITGSGLQVGTFTLIKYAGAPLANLANFVLNPPPGVAAVLVNNTANHSIDLQVTGIPNQLTWYGEAGANWDLSTVNWKTILAADTLFRQYTNGSVVAGDAVTFDDTLTNDFVNPQPTNINLTGTFYAFPVVVNSTLPYSISGPGGITGVTSLLKSNSGSLTLTLSNSFTGGVSINDSGALYVSSDAALGASSGNVALNGGTLGYIGGTTNGRPISLNTNTAAIDVATNITARLTGAISGSGNLVKTGNGTLVLAANEKFTGNVFGKAGTLVLDSGGFINNGGNYSSIGQSGSDVAAMILKGTGFFTNNGDFNVGDIDTATGTLTIQDSAILNVQNLFLGSANAAGSTASGTLNMNGGTLIQRNTAVGTFDLGGRNSGNAGNGTGVINLNGGYISVASGARVGDYGSGTINQFGGLLEITNNGTGINLRRQSNGGSGTYNLNGGTLRVEKVTSSQTSGTREFYFNGGTLQAGNGNLGATAFMNNLSHAYVRNGAAVVDSQGYNITISQPLEHSIIGGDNAVDGGLTKAGSGTLTVTGNNTFTGPITNRAGTLLLNGAGNYSNAVVNAGLLQINSASTIQGSTTVSNAATLALVQTGSSLVAISNLTLNGIASGNGAVLNLTPGSGNPAVPIASVGTLTLNGTNTIALTAAAAGTNALIKYAALAGSGNLTNLTLPQGATGYISNSVADSTLYAIITSTGPGLVWTGTNAAALNVWDINTTTNWTVNGIPTSYHQIINPGDAVVFNDSGSGTVTLNANVAPASLTISNNAKAYTFGGTGGISGGTSLVKLGTGTAILNLTNDTYAGNTVISNGTLQMVNTGVGSSLSPSGNLVVGSSGTLSLSSTTPNPTTQVAEFSGAGKINYTGGFNSVLSFGGAAGGTWNGSIADAGGGGLSLTKNGTGTWVVGGSNYLGNSDFFNAVSQVQVNNGTVVVTNGGLLSVAITEFWIAQGAGSTGTVVVAGGTLAVSNNWLVVGRADATANGTLIVNSGTVSRSGNNNIVVGSSGATGTLIVNGGQVLNTSDLWLGENATGSGTLFLNGGLVQADVVRPNNPPVVASIANFNGGTLQATTNSTDFLQSTSLILSNGLVLDDGGWAINILSQALTPGDAFNGGLVKKGSGTVYLDNANTYTGTTLVTNGVLAGVGSVVSPVVVAPNGGVGAGDAGALGTFTINNNLTIQGKAFMRINKDTAPASDVIVDTGTVHYGGTLVISNASTTALTTSDTFQLFTASSHTGNFASIAGSPGTGLAYSFNPNSGVLSVVVNTINTNPTNITVSGVSGGNMTLSWPADHLGWTLQSNAVSLTSSSNWFDYPPSTGSRDTTQVTIPTGAGTNVFFRLKYP